MTEQNTPLLEQTVPPAGAPAVPPKGQKKKRRGRSRVWLWIVVAVAAVVGVAVLLWYFVFRETEELGAVMVDTVQRGSIQLTVEGSGMTKARNSATVTPGSGTILELYVKEGDQVTEGQQLYKMDDTAAREAVADAQEAVDNCQKALQAVYDKIAQLTITAPHSGNLREVGEWKVGDTVNEGDTIATIVNDTKLRLSLYYSYAYDGQIKVGQTAQISIPAVMGSRTGTVEQVNRVRFVSPEGAAHFEVVFVLDNPGTLTEGMEASAALTGPDGAPIYPYENGKLAFYETTAVKAKATGPVEQYGLMRYADVKAGQVLARLGAEDTDQEIAQRQEELKGAQEKLTAANEELGKYNAVSPIAGTVLSCSLTEGAEVQSGQGVSIADTTQMVVEISVDERNARYVKAGMMVNIDQYGTPYMGIVESVSMTASGENGVASIPAVVTVDNVDGSMIPGTYVNYSFVASQSDDCLTVPVQAVMYVSFANVTLPDTLDAPAVEGDPYGDMEGEPPYDGMEDGMDVEEELPPEDDLTADGAVYRQSGGLVAQPLMAVAMPAPDMGGGGYGMGGEDTPSNTIVFVQADQAPANAILEPDPVWECPEGFWAVPVEVGLSDNTRAEILRGLNEGDVVYIGRETQSADSWG